MLTLVRLVRNGNGIMVTIPKPMLQALGWLPGEHVAILLNEDKTITAMRLTRDDLMRAAAHHAVAPSVETTTV